jgi:DNA repair exonuclease SbcCD ATPase subunit
MSTKRLALRRFTTMVGVIAVLALGFGSIKAASAWTAAAAPLKVSPVSVATLQANLTTEKARSEALSEQLLALDARSRDLEAALTAAKDRIDADAGHAGDLEDQLAAAAKKLSKLEAAIAKAKRALAAQAARAAVARPATTTTAGRSSGGEHDEDDEHEDDDD